MEYFFFGDYWLLWPPLVGVPLGYLLSCLKRSGFRSALFWLAALAPILLFFGGGIAEGCFSSGACIWMGMGIWFLPLPWGLWLAAMAAGVWVYRAVHD